jgi:hypothetical protein
VDQVLDGNGLTGSIRGVKLIKSGTIPFLPPSFVRLFVLHLVISGFISVNVCFVDSAAWTLCPTGISADQIGSKKEPQNQCVSKTLSKCHSMSGSVSVLPGILEGT